MFAGSRKLSYGREYSRKTNQILEINPYEKIISPHVIDYRNECNLHFSIRKSIGLQCDTFDSGGVLSTVPKTAADDACILSTTPHAAAAVGSQQFVPSPGLVLLRRRELQYDAVSQ